jgi:flagellar basal-body rod protein FlgB
MSNVPTISDLESYLSLTNKRATVVAANMANIDTPGYHTQDFNFNQELQLAMTANLKQDQATPSIHSLGPVPGLLERPDGNNVNLDREAMLLSEVQLQAQMGTQLLKSHLHQLLTAINGGGQ